MANNPPGTPSQHGARCRPTDVCDLLLDHIRQNFHAYEAAGRGQHVRQLATEASNLKQQLLAHALQPMMSQQRVLTLMQNTKAILGENAYHETLQRAVSMIATGPVQQNAAAAGAQPQNSSIMQAYLRAQAQSRGGNAQMTGATQNSSAVAAAAAAIMRQGHQNSGQAATPNLQGPAQNRLPINNAQFIQQLRALQQQQQQQQQQRAGQQSNMPQPSTGQQAGTGSGVSSQLANTLQDQINRILSPRPSPMGSPSSAAGSEPVKRPRVEASASLTPSRPTGNLLLPPSASPTTGVSPQRPTTPQTHGTPSPVGGGEVGGATGDALDALEQLIMQQQQAPTAPIASPSASPLSMGVMPPNASPGWDAGSPSASPSPLSLASTPQIDIESVRRAHKEQMLLRISHRVQRRGVALASEEVLTALGEVMEHWAEVAQQMLHRISKHRAELYPSQIAKHLSQSRDTSTEEWYRRKKEQAAYMGALCKAVVEHRERATQEAAEARANRTGTGQGAKSRAAAAAASRAAGGSLPSPEEMRQQEMEQQQAMQDRLVTGANRSLVNAERMLSTENQRKQIVAEALEQHVTSIQDVRKVGLRDLMTLLKMPPPNGHSTWIHGVPMPEGMRQRMLVEISQGAYSREYNVRNEQRSSGGARG
ncbi:hypothetical protein Pmar_PMAR005272 [Perkinsus marinus ATCC 50983]|uniref:Uncharacterized protein n=1 Tax=Perkinsus marinus (strain ATCC 50983 / TXsc) TaxID=423536 RepID=C5KB36_PERM5|nr:hypothetical protein Pmar_PMAR005272 [Perkinsus marinus ATCC 50983]EER18362.1 hypothetical protein Pmar_PMAR005272 [Perkinsus marinus ATCC 50983]|eukprot:XP_002786566.1 hypothetical protein Pmar_PMAR005272 [Perkinsus marinus ATCC 50983]